jgi:WD40 repeat protein
METSGGSNSGSGLVLSYGSLKQIKILQSGCQRSNRNILHCAGDRFAYCAALTVNMYNLSSHKLEKIIHVHSKQIAGMSFSRSNPDVFVTCSDDLTAKRWNVNELKELATVDLPSPPCMIEWCHVGDSVAVLLRSGHVYMWNEGKSLELIAALGDCVRIRWDYKRGDNYTPRLAAAQRNGTLAIWDKATSTVSKILITSDRTSVTGLISDLQWDPTSNKYVLVSFEEGNMFLADVDQKIVQTEYLSEKQVMMTAFVHKDGGGGDFLTIDSDLPNVSVWNVSRPIARSRFRVGDKRCAIVSIKSLDLDNYPRHIALAFADGSTGLYNLGAPEGGKFVFLSQPAHSETVFDCQFKPGAPDIFATASNDGSLRIWDLSTMECLNDFTSTEVLYAASWCPGDEDEHRIVTV